jgi:hypothetical protein
MSVSLVLVISSSLMVPSHIPPGQAITLAASAILVANINRTSSPEGASFF